MLPTNQNCDHNAMINGIQNAGQAIKLSLSHEEATQFLFSLKKEGYYIKEDDSHRKKWKRENSPASLKQQTKVQICPICRGGRTIIENGISNVG